MQRQLLNQILTVCSTDTLCHNWPFEEIYDLDMAQKENELNISALGERSYLKLVKIKTDSSSPDDTARSEQKS